MWALETIDYSNGEYVREERERYERVDVESYLERELPPSSPLETLIARLRKPSPVNVGYLINLYIPDEYLADWLRIVHEILPDHEKEILKSESPTVQMGIFVKIFERQFFPLYTDFVDFENITSSIPILFRTYTGRWYESLPEGGSPEYVVLAYVLENPYAEGDRAAFGEAAARYIPEGILKHIPAEGFKMEELEELLKSTKFEILSKWADALTWHTGNPWFDCGDVDEVGIDYSVEWNLPTVKKLTEFYHEWNDWHTKWHKFLKWYTTDFLQNTIDLIDILNERSGNGIDKIHYYDPDRDPNQGKLFNVGTDKADLAGPTKPQTASG